MTIAPRITETTDVYQGPIFTIRDMRIALTTVGGGDHVIRRQLIAHAPAVIMLPHDTTRDLYLTEREYRVGRGTYVPGLPAGMIDEGEDPHTAMLRELREETGVVPDDYEIIDVSDCYSSEGMTDEHAYVAIIDIAAWHDAGQNFDPDEYVDCQWVTWDELITLDIREAHSHIAVLAEKIRRIQAAAHISAATPL